MFAALHGLLIVIDAQTIMHATGIVLHTLAPWSSGGIEQARGIDTKLF